MIHQDELIKRAFDAWMHAYTPYSKFPVGACLELKDGTFVMGTNVENASYGLTNCAERSALYSAYSFGYSKEDIIAMAVVTKCDHLISPCGACRQVMIELLKEDTPIFICNEKQIKQVTVRELLPLSFTGKDLI